MANTLNISQIIGSEDEFYRKFRDSIMNNLRGAMPGIIQSFDDVEQTVIVKLALREQIIQPDQSKIWTDIPLLLDVPIVVPRGGDAILTVPIQQGDECLVIFGDVCIDAWWSYGGTQNQIEKRRHDLSDGFAIVGLWSQPRRISKYSTTATELRTLDGNTKISLKAGEIDIVANSVKINGVDFTDHTHIAPYGGGKTSGPS